ncbi:MAG TPA: T9SS type A sorting domain-containing protein [Bacteroidia bacterium]|nr:T9SS type A sorting domain-containing protein [Bacteroidia bacterium]
MKKQFKSGIIATIIALTFGSAYSQVPVQWSRTLQLEGYWEGPAALILGGQTFNLVYHTDFKTAVNGNALTMDEGFSDPALGELKGANLIGLNAADGLIHWSSVDNFGTAHEHIGSWLNSKHFYMEHQSIQGGQTFIEKIDFRFRANNQRIKVSLVATLDGDTVQVIEGILYKQNSRLANVNTEEDDEIIIYPNPSDGKVTIESPDIIDEIKITNESGQLIYQVKPNETDFSLQLEEAGVYFVQVTSTDKAETKKIILTK